MPKSTARRTAKRKLVSDDVRREMLRILKQRYPDPHCALEHKTPLQLLISTILSAQCTDVRVNLVTPALFARYKSAEDYAQADPAELSEYIKSTGFYNSKTKNIIAAARGLVDKHGGEVPSTMEDLVGLAGVGRKTANVVLGNAFGIAGGVVVDTHVQRLSRRLSWTKHKEPGKIEIDLCEAFPRREWVNLSHRLIFHGREICFARKPKCGACPLSDLCPRIGVTVSA